MVRITNCCVLNLCQVQHYSRNEHGCVSSFQPVLFFSSAWTKDAPCLPWKQKLLSSHRQLPLKWIYFHLCEWSCHKCTSDGNPHAGHFSMHPFYPSPLVFSQVTF
ncbi:uncharacterized protein WM294_008138 [Sarcoramphus papa]